MRPEGLRYRPLRLCALVTLALAASGGGARSNEAPGTPKAIEERMSPAGQLAASTRATLAAGDRARMLDSPLAAAPNECGEELECRGKTTRQPGGQTELSIAVDDNGQNIVIGYNDTRGFFTNPNQVSGYIISHDGGKTFSPDGLLPTDGMTYIFGDPDVKYLGACDFAYSSIGLVAINGPLGPVYAQSMVVHRTRDCGDTWEGPFEVPSASNPNGSFDGGSPVDAADKEFIDVDPETGRVLMSWSNFTPFAPGGVEIRTTYSDDILTATPPTWSTSAIVAASPADGQSSIPRFAGNGSDRVYLAWRRYSSFFGRVTGFAFSDDNGQTWSAPTNTSAPFLEMDQVLGNDRINTSPSLAVGRGGEIYLVYANNNRLDGADIVFQRSTDRGLTLSAPVLVNAAPGGDRAQWFPWVTTDSRSGRVYVFYYDQGIAPSGDLSEVSVTWSDDKGDNWSAPVPLTDRPFKAGWGNNTGQPNLGDYNQAVAQQRTLFAAYGLTEPPPGGFAGSQPNGYFEVPNVDFQRVRNRKLDGQLPVSLGPVNAVAKKWHGHGHRGGCRRHEDHLLVTLPLRNYTTNPISAGILKGIWAHLRDKTPGVEVEGYPGRWYGTLAPGETREQTFVLGDAARADEAVANADDAAPLGGEHEIADRLSFRKARDVRNVEWITADVRLRGSSTLQHRQRALPGLVGLGRVRCGPTHAGDLWSAFADQFTTGSFDHYPKHLPRNSDPRYFGDMSVWAGDSGGVQHVRMRLPGMQGSTAQLRFEYTQDGGSSCPDPTSTGGVCGVFVDNIVVKSHTVR